MVARIKNPYKPSLFLLIFAGIRVTGTKAAVIAFTRQTRLVLRRYSGQDDFCAIVQGYDLDGDGKIDNNELLE